MKDTSNILVWTENSRIEAWEPCDLIVVPEKSRSFEITVSPNDIDAYAKAINRVGDYGYIEHIFTNNGTLFYCPICKEAAYVEETKYGATAKYGKLEMTDDKMTLKTEYEEICFQYIDADDFQPNLTGWYKEE